MHPCLDVVAVNSVYDVSKSVCNRNNTKQALPKHPISPPDSDNDYILGEIEHRDRIELERNSKDDGDEE